MFFLNLRAEEEDSFIGHGFGESFEYPTDHFYLQ